jgi:hypothetical protein
MSHAPASFRHRDCAIRTEQPLHNIAGKVAA